MAAKHCEPGSYQTNSRQQSILLRLELLVILLLGDILRKLGLLRGAGKDSARVDNMQPCPNACASAHLLHLLQSLLSAALVLLAGVVGVRHGLGSTQLSGGADEFPASPRIPGWLRCVY